MLRNNQLSPGASPTQHFIWAAVSSLSLFMFSQIICQNLFSSLGEEGKKKKKGFLPSHPSPLFCMELITVFSSGRVGKMHTELKQHTGQRVVSACCLLAADFS